MLFFGVWDTRSSTVVVVGGHIRDDNLLIGPLNVHICMVKWKVTDYLLTNWGLTSQCTSCRDFVFEFKRLSPDVRWLVSWSPLWPLATLPQRHPIVSQTTNGWGLIDLKEWKYADLCLDNVCAKNDPFKRIFKPFMYVSFLKSDIIWRRCYSVDNVMS